MTKSLIYIALFALSFPALAQTQKNMGHHGIGHAEMHHWYETLRDRKGRQCCSGRDCRPTESRLRDGKIEVMVDGIWAPVPAEKILDETLEACRNRSIPLPSTKEYQQFLRIVAASCLPRQRKQARHSLARLPRSHNKIHVPKQLLPALGESKQMAR